LSTKSLLITEKEFLTSEKEKRKPKKMGMEKKLAGRGLLNMGGGQGRRESIYSA